MNRFVGDRSERYSFSSPSARCRKSGSSSHLLETAMTWGSFLMMKGFSALR
jgi:hypothetical protein